MLFRNLLRECGAKAESLPTGMPSYTGQRPVDDLLKMGGRVVVGVGVVVPLM